MQIFARTKMPCLCKVLGRKLVQKVWEMVGKITLVENSEKMSSKARETLQDYYRDSVKELEKVLGRDLSKVWFE